MHCYCSCISEINKKVADILAAQMTVEQLQERDQFLSAQNEMLKVHIIIKHLHLYCNHIDVPIYMFCLYWVLYLLL